MFHVKNIVISQVFSSFNLSTVFKDTFLFNETKFSAVNCLQWHYILKYLFCGTLYIQLKSKTCSVPLQIFTLLRYSLLLIKQPCKLSCNSYTPPPLSIERQNSKTQAFQLDILLTFVNNFRFNIDCKIVLMFCMLHKIFFSNKLDLFEAFSVLK